MICTEQRNPLNSKYNWHLAHPVREYNVHILVLCDIWTVVRRKLYLQAKNTACNYKHQQKKDINSKKYAHKQLHTNTQYIE